MKHLTRAPCFVTMATLILSCGPSQPRSQTDPVPPLTSAESIEMITGVSPTDESGESGNESGSDEDFVCEPETEFHEFCDGECVWTDISNEHCGECKRACAPYDIDGHCEFGRCTSVRGACITADDGFMTCEEYCASIGELCGSAMEDISHPCYGAIFLYSSELCSITNFAFQDLDDPSAACDTPIPFGEMFDFDLTANSARCCCTQYGGK